MADAAAFAFHDPGSIDQCWLAVVGGPGFSPDTLASFLAPHLPPLCSVRTLVVDRLPRNAMGKVEHVSLRALAEGMLMPAPVLLSA